MQLEGFTVVTEYTSRFEADLAANRLIANGMQATVLSGAAHQVAPHIVTQRGHRLLVATGDADEAALLLAETAPAATPRTPQALGLGRRPRWFRWLAYALVLAFIVPAVGGAIQALINVLS